MRFHSYLSSRNERRSSRISESRNRCSKLPRKFELSVQISKLRGQAWHRLTVNCDYNYDGHIVVPFYDFCGSQFISFWTVFIPGILESHSNRPKCELLSEDMNILRKIQIRVSSFSAERMTWFVSMTTSRTHQWVQCVTANECSFSCWIYYKVILRFQSAIYIGHGEDRGGTELPTAGDWTYNIQFARDKRYWVTSDQTFHQILSLDHI